MKEITKPKNLGTTIIDIYEAAGGEVSEDRTHVVLSKPKPFKIELLVIPTAVETRYDAPDEVTFGVLLHDEVLFESDIMGHRVLDHSFDVSLKLPVQQVKIIKEEVDGN